MQRLSIEGKYKAIARQFYLLTGHKIVSVNDFREYRLHTHLRNLNQIGAFFESLTNMGVLIKTGDKVKASHKQAKGRMVNSYIWGIDAKYLLEVY